MPNIFRDDVGNVSVLRANLQLSALDIWGVIRTCEICCRTFERVYPDPPGAKPFFEIEEIRPRFVVDL